MYCFSTLKSKYLLRSEHLLAFSIFCHLKLYMNKYRITASNWIRFPKKEIISLNFLCRIVRFLYRDTFDRSSPKMFSLGRAPLSNRQVQLIYWVAGYSRAFATLCEQLTVLSLLTLFEKVIF